MKIVLFMRLCGKMQ